MTHEHGDGHNGVECRAQTFADMRALHVTMGPQRKRSQIAFVESFETLLREHPTESPRLTAALVLAQVFHGLALATEALGVERGCDLTLDALVCVTVELSEPKTVRE